MRKLENRSKKVINLGREPGTKEYRLYDPESGRIHVSRDVIFEETTTWPWTERGNDKFNFTQFSNLEVGESNEEDIVNTEVGHDSDDAEVTDTSPEVTPSS